MKQVMFKIVVFSLLGLLPLLSFADRDRSDRRSHDRRDRPSPDYRLDKRFDHNRSYPREGHTVRILPRKRHPIHFRNRDYYYFGGVWYQPSGLDFVVIHPPLGIIVPILPPFYTTLWLGDLPYYYANGVYYQWRADLNGYEVVDAPDIPEDKQPTTYLADKLFIYPKKGQSKEQQADDRYACHRYGVEESKYDPSQPPTGVSTENLSQQRENYQRAMKACLEGRGYSVR